jgi:effector-binding domain-containing protein
MYSKYETLEPVWQATLATAEKCGLETTEEARDVDSHAENPC